MELDSLKLLKEYMNIYIQLLPYCVTCGGLFESQLPTFEYFKKTYNDERYSLVIPHYKECVLVYDKDKINLSYTKGLGNSDGIAYRYYCDWMGYKYFLDGKGYFTGTKLISPDVFLNK